MDTQGRRNIDPADQWVLDPATGTYQLRLEPDGAEPQAAPARGNGQVSAPRSAEPSRDSSTPARSGPAGPRSRRRPKPRRSRKKLVLAWAGGAAGLVLVTGTLGAYLVYQHINNNITTVDVGDAGSKSVTHDGPMNILVIGTDSRQGLGSRYGDAGSPGHADTTIVLHLSADRTNATALSIPRDIVTDIPDCPTRQPDGSTKVVPGTPRQVSAPRFNQSLGQDGRDPGCTMRVVSQLTGLRMDHFMMVDFQAVKTLSTAVGGVDVCLSRPLVDPKSHLDLAAGPHRIEGEQALEFVRTRHALRNQSDLDRIKLQQNFLGAMIRRIKSAGTLTSPAKLWTLANAATKALTVDSAIGSVSKLSGLATDLSRVDAGHIAFTTLPVMDNPEEKVRATVVVDTGKAAPLLEMIRRDASLTRRAKAPAAPAPRQAELTTAPPDARVDVLNGSGILGAAQATVDYLQNVRGVDRSVNAGNAPTPAARTVLEYAPALAGQARSLAAMMGLPATALQETSVDATRPDTMTLTLGADFVRPGVPIGAPPAVADGVQKTVADSTACVG